MNAFRLGRRLLLAAVVVVVAPAAEAGIHRCVSPSGAVTYTDKPCPRDAPPAAESTAAEPVAAQPSAIEPAIVEPVIVEPAVAGAAAEAAEMESPPRTEKSMAEPEVLDQATADGVGSRPIDVNSYVANSDTPLRPRKSKSAHWGLFFLGLAAAFVAYVMHIVSAFRADRIAWGVALILLAPISNLLYAVLHWRRALPGLVLGLAGTTVAVAAYVPPDQLIDVTDSYLTAQGSYDVEDRRAREVFTLDERVHLKTILDWDDPSVETVHYAYWLWYTDDELVGQSGDALRLDDMNYVMLANMPAAELGTGRHRVEFHLGSQLLDSREFEVIP